MFIDHFQSSLFSQHSTSENYAMVFVYGVLLSGWHISYQFLLKHAYFRHVYVM